jgi:hypothetical protein
MAFGATLTITVNAVAKVLDRINQGNYSSEYLFATATEEWRVFIRHSKETPSKEDGRYFERHQFLLRHTIFAVAGTSPERVNECYTIYRTQHGNDITLAKYDSNALVDYLDVAQVHSDLWGWLN